MPKTNSRKPQVNVQLDDLEFTALKTLCDAENIKSPATLAGIWIRENLKLRDASQSILGVVREAQASGVDVVAVLAKARRAENRRA